MIHYFLVLFLLVLVLKLQIYLSFHSIIVNNSNIITELHFDYDEIIHYAHNHAFKVAKITKLDLLKDIQESLANAELKGIGFDEWKKISNQHLQKKVG